jgi:TonB family protein
VRKVQLFNIPAQPLASALQAYSAVTGDEVILDGRLAASKRSSAVVGLFTSETALRMLLDGTDLTIRHTGPQDVTLVAADAIGSGADPRVADSGGDRVGVMVLDTLYVDLPPGAERRPDFSEYGRMVRLDVKRALARDAETSNRVFDLQIDIWIDREGRVERPRLLASTGRPRLDAAIRRVLASTTLEKPPPPDLPQPVRIAVVAI